MSVRRLILLGGAVLFVAGIIAVLIPVSISNGDGSSIGCGNALSTDLAGARSANSSSIAGVPILNQVVPHTDYVAQCESAVSDRRTWSIPLVIVGVVAAAGSAVTGRGQRVSG